MPLRLRCPKCETALREGTRRCPLCATPLRTGVDDAPTHGPPVIDPLLALFDRDEMLRACPWCRNEFTAGARRCTPCARELAPTARSTFEADLTSRPVADRGRKLAAGPPPPPKDLRRVRVAETPESAAAFLTEFRAYGVEAWPGADAFEPAADALPVGLWVRETDLVAADYVLGSERDGPRNPPPPESARDRDLRRARLYLGFGRFRIAAALAGAYAGDVEAEELAADALLGGGRVREAERRAASAVGSDAASRAKLAVLAGVAAALGNAGAPFGPGSRFDAALGHLRRAATESPRYLTAGKALLETLDAAGRRDEAAAECRRLTKLNPNLFALDGWFRDCSDRLRARAG
jgi:hypothetical protein